MRAALFCRLSRWCDATQPFWASGTRPLRGGARSATSGIVAAALKDVHSEIPPIICMKEYLEDVPLCTKQEMLRFFGLRPLEFDAIIFNLAPRGRVFYTNLPQAHHIPSMND